MESAKRARKKNHDFEVCLFGMLIKNKKIDSTTNSSHFFKIGVFFLHPVGDKMVTSIVC